MGSRKPETCYYVRHERQKTGVYPVELPCFGECSRAVGIAKSDRRSANQIEKNTLMNRMLPIPTYWDEG